MCLAIFISKGSKLKREYAAAGFSRNSHGAGFAYVDNGKLFVQKGFFSFEDFWQNFSQIQDSINSPFMVHFRLATSGRTDDVNCHPWVIDENNALIHNGIFFEYSGHPQISDTGIFTHKVIKPIAKFDPNYINDDQFKQELENGVGQFNKLVFLNSKEEYAIIGESGGVWDDGIWYSNCGYKPFQFSNYHNTHNSNGFKKGKKKDKKEYLYRFPGSTKFLSQKEICHITHKHKKKLKKLVQAGVIEKVINQKTDDEEYKEWWERHICLD